jgi:hypothetical protein
MGESNVKEHFMPCIGHRVKQVIASIVVVLAAGVAGTGHSFAASVNVLATNTSTAGTGGVFGVLRAGAPWAPGPLASPLSVVDGVFLPPGTVWNQGSVWWDADPSVNAFPAAIGVQLTGPFALDRFVVQGDDNDVYQVEYWNGSTWLPAYTAPAVGGFGMQTRDSGLLAPITTTALRITGNGGDGYYSISEIQAFSTTVVPVPGALLLFASGAGAFGLLMRRRSGRPAVD